MKLSNECPLSLAQLNLLKACVTQRTTDAKDLARALGKSPFTVRNQFARILETLETHNRTAAIVIAVERGWISINAPDRAARFPVATLDE